MLVYQRVFGSKSPMFPSFFGGDSSGDPALAPFRRLDGSGPRLLSWGATEAAEVPACGGARPGMC